MNIFVGSLQCTDNKYVSVEYLRSNTE